MAGGGLDASEIFNCVGEENETAEANERFPNHAQTLLLKRMPAETENFTTSHIQALHTVWTPCIIPELPS